jgi:hypothetical protein
VERVAGEEALIRSLANRWVFLPIHKMINKKGHCSPFKVCSGFKKAKRKQKPEKSQNPACLPG